MPRAREHRGAELNVWIESRSLSAFYLLNMSNPLLGAVFSRASDQIWSMLDLTDVLRLSMCAKVTTNLGMDSETIHDLLERNKNAMKVGNFTIKFPDELSIGLLRRILHTLNTGKEASVHIDAKSGRIILDVGTAFTEREVFRPSDLQPNTDNESEADNQEIFQHLEKCSMDEYDDFNPRHPKPRERAHRRGDSYFNSDIDMVVNELYSGLGPAGCDLKNIAASAAKDPELPTPP